jgi:hypothetical protein
MKRFLSLLALAVALMLSAITRPALAQPDTASPVTMGHAPVIADPDRIVIPTVPTGYLTETHGPLHVSFPAAARERVHDALRDVPEFQADLRRKLGADVLHGVDVRIVPSPKDMVELAPVGAPPPAYASGVAYSRLRLVLITMTAPRTYEGTDVREVLRHELVHVALDEALEGRHVPRWFNEGLAIHASGEGAMSRMQALSVASMSGTLLPLQTIDRNFPEDATEVSVAYAQSADFVRFLLRDGEGARFASMFDRLRAGQPFERAMADSYGTSLRTLEYQWHEDLTHRYSFWPTLAGGSVLWMVTLVALGVAYWRRKRHAKTVLARWEREEKAHDEAIAAASKMEIELELDAYRASIMVPHVEHDGRTHTLH